MISYTVVTTCNAAGWNQYGRRMAESFLEHWPVFSSLIIYPEGFEPEDLESSTDGAIYGIERLPSWLDVFKARHRNNNEANGWRSGKGYDFRLDAVRFSHKIAAICDAAERVQDGVLIWLDADTRTHSRVTHEWLEGLFPGDACLAWPDRENMYPECGVLMFRVKHPMFKLLIGAMRTAYEGDAIFSLPETHDSYVLQRIVHNMHIPHASLSGSARNCSHPVARGPLSKCLDHLKGARKSLDHSPEHAVLR